MCRQIIVCNIQKGPLLAKQKTTEKYCPEFFDCLIYFYKTSGSNIKKMLILARDRRWKSANEILHGTTATEWNALPNLRLLLVVSNFYTYCSTFEQNLHSVRSKQIIVANNCGYCAGSKLVVIKDYEIRKSVQMNGFSGWLSTSAKTNVCHRQSRFHRGIYKSVIVPIWAMVFGGSQSLNRVSFLPMLA